MKGFLLAAGNGTRLRPLTNSIPKCLMPIHGTPLLGVWLQWCAMYGVDQVLINTHSHSEHVGEFLAAYRGPIEVKMTYEPGLLGSAGTIYANRAFVASEQEFAVLYADVLTNCRFDKMLEYHRLRRAPVTVGTYHVSNPTQCGIIVPDENGRVIEFTEKPEMPKSTAAFSGVMIGGPSLLSGVPAKVPADLGFDVLPNLVGKMFAFPIADYVLDIGTIEKYEQAQREWHGLSHSD